MNSREQHDAFMAHYRDTLTGMRRDATLEHYLATGDTIPIPRTRQSKIDAIENIIPDACYQRNHTPNLVTARGYQSICTTAFHELITTLALYHPGDARIRQMAAYCQRAKRGVRRIRKSLRSGIVVTSAVLFGDTDLPLVLCDPSYAVHIGDVVTVAPETLGYYLTREGVYILAMVRRHGTLLRAIEMTLLPTEVQGISGDVIATAGYYIDQATLLRGSGVVDQHRYIP